MNPEILLALIAELYEAVQQKNIQIEKLAALYEGAQKQIDDFTNNNVE